MKIFKKITALVLTLIIAVVGLPFCTVSAEDSEYIYLSDIYYSYSPYISKSDILSEYTTQTEKILYQTLENYVNSDSFIWTEIKSAFQTADSITEWFKLVLSGYFGQGFVKSDAIDSANLVFVQALLNTGGVEEVNTIDSIGDKLVKLIDIFEKYSDWSVNNSASNQERIRKAFEMLQNSGILKKIDSSRMSALLNEILPNINTVSGLASIGGNMIKLGKTLMIAIMLEDMRLEIIGDVVANAPSNTTLYEGMTRLYSEMSDGTASYVFDNYIKSGALDKIGEMVTEKISEAFLKDKATLVTVVGIVMDVSASLIFYNKPNVNDLMVQMVLSEYVSGMQSVVYAYDNHFEDGNFGSADIKTHQNLMMALQCLTDVALETTKDIAVYSSDKSTMNYLQNRYGGNFNLYSYVIAEIKTELSNLAPEDRQRVFYDSWCLKEDMVFADATDKPTDDKIYLTNGNFNGNINAYYGKGLFIPEGTAATVNGNLNFDNGNYITVGGRFEVMGNFNVIYANMNNPEATLLLGGNVEITNSWLSSGTVVLNGNETQEIYGLSCNNLTVTNPKGIKYLSSISVTGKFLLNSNPIIDNGYYVSANSQEVLFDSVSNYKNVVINSDLVINYEITGDLTIGGCVTIPANETTVINGNVTLGYSGGIVNEGKLKINGDIKENRFASSSSIENSGILSVLGDVNVINIFMSEENAVFTFGGDLNVTNDYISNGTVILNGSEQQTLCECGFYNLTVLNPNGIKYNGNIGINGKYLLGGNPLDNNGYVTLIFSNTAYLDSDSDYKEVCITSDWSLSNVVNANLSAYYGKNLSIPKGANAGINGNLNLGNGNGLIADGNFSVTGNAIVIYAYMEESDATLSVGGNIDFTNSWLSNGTVVLNGTETQELYGLNCHNLIVTNPEGVKYLSSVSVTGSFVSSGNPIDNNGYYTQSNSQNVEYDSVTDYGDIVINAEIELKNDIIANITISGKIIVPEDADVTINGDVTLGYSGELVNKGKLTINGDIKENRFASSSSIENSGILSVLGDVNVINIFMSEENAVFTFGGDLNVTNDYISNGTVILNGSEQQTLCECGFYNLTVLNPEGVKYNGNIGINGKYLLGGNPLDNNGYVTLIFSNTAYLDSDSDYKEVYITSDWSLSNVVNANLSAYYGKNLSIPKGANAGINGNLNLGNGNGLLVDGNFSVTGNAVVIYAYMEESDATLSVGGNIYFTNGWLSNGTVVLNGSEKQTVNRVSNVPIIVIENTSQDGVVFECDISPKLFNHNGNKYTLYNNGRGSVFADYDGDLVTDEKDELPTVFSDKNYCEKLCDVTSDGKTNVLDFITVMKSAVGGNLTDINRDGNADIYDMVYVKKVLLGIYEIVSKAVA